MVLLKIISQLLFQPVQPIPGYGIVILESLWGYSFLILLVRNERFCLDEVFYLLVMDEAARFMGFVRVLIPLDCVGL